MERLKLQLRFDCSFIVSSRGSSGGLYAMWKDEANLLLRSYMNNHIDFEVGGVGELNHRRLTCFYGFPAEVDRHKSWTLLGQLHANSSLPWYCIGDFNKVLQTDEQERGDLRCERQMAGFRNCLARCSLIDMGYWGEQVHLGYDSGMRH
ncbi:hypothetical protein ACFX15_012564 [Malus domestica]